MDVNELKEKYSQLLDKKQELEKKKLQLEADFNASKKREEEILKELKDSYKVSSLDDARNLFEEKRKEIEKHLTECSEVLGVE